MRYLIVLEKAEKNYSAYAPDVPGCIATGKTVEETIEMMKEALEFHFEDGEDIPESISQHAYVDVRLPEGA